VSTKLATNGVPVRRGTVYLAALAVVSLGRVGLTEARKLGAEVISGAEDSSGLARVARLQPKANFGPVAVHSHGVERVALQLETFRAARGTWWVR